MLSFDLEIQTGKVLQWDRQCSFQRLGIAPSQLEAEDAKLHLRKVITHKIKMENSFIDVWEGPQPENKWA